MTDDALGLGMMLTLGLDNAAQAISEVGSVFVIIALQTMTSNLEDYMWNLRGRP